MTTASSSPSLSPGDKIDKFEIVDQIGAGGMGIVWKAYDRLLDRYVAIKQLTIDPSELAGGADALHERFRAEAHLQRRLAEGSEHLVKIIDFIDEPRGLFIVMEYVKGSSLEQVLTSENQPMDERRALGIVAAAALGLQHIHRQGVIHRDLKPSNILLPATGGLKVCDFGLAALIDDQEAMSVGSVRYMAPELFNASGDVRPDGRADIYALGMIAYEMLLGRQRFAEAFKIVLRDQRNQALRWMKWHTNVRAKAPALSSLLPSVSPALDELIGRMMEKDPAKRIGSADDLLDAIRRHFSGQPASHKALADKPAASAATTVDAAPDTPTAALPRRSKLPAVLVGMLLVLALVAGGLYYSQYRAQRLAAEQVRNTAVERFEAARQRMAENDYAAALPEFEALAAAWPNDREIGESSRLNALFCRANLAFAADRIDDAKAAIQSLKAANVRGDLVPNLERKVLDREAFLKEVARIERFIDAGQHDQARLALRQQQQVKLTEQEEAVLHELATRLEGQITQARVQATIEEAEALEAQGRLKDAIALLDAALLRMTSSELERAHNRLSTAVKHRDALASARAAEADDQLAEAIEAYQEAQSLRPEPQVAQKISQLKSEQAFREGRQFEVQGRYDEAARAYTRALGLYEQNTNARDALQRLKVADQRAAFMTAGDQAMREGDFEQAITQYELAIKLGTDETLELSLRKARVALGLREGRTALSRGETDQARKHFSDVLAVDPDNTQAARGLEDVSRWSEYVRLRDLGDEQRRQSRYREAKRAYRNAQEVLDTEAIRQRLDDVEFESLMAAARADITAGNWASARNWLLVAGRLRMTDEVRELLAQVNANDPLPRSIEDDE